LLPPWLLRLAVAVLSVGKALDSQAHHNLGPLGGGSPDGPGLKAQMTPPTDTPAKSGASGQ